MTQQEFQTYYIKEIYPLLKDIEKRRLGVLFRNYLWIYLISFIVVLSAFLIPELAEYRTTIIVFGLVFSFALNWILQSFDKSEIEYYRALKNVVIPKIISLYSDDFEYNIDKYVNPKNFVKSGLVPPQFHRSSGNDLIVLKINNKTIHFSFIKTSEVKFRNHRGGTKQHTTTLFAGVFIMISSNDDFGTVSKTKMHEWTVASKENHFYLCKEQSILFCEPSLMKSLKNPSTFESVFNLLNEVFDQENGLINLHNKR